VGGGRLDTVVPGDVAPEPIWTGQHGYAEDCFAGQQDRNRNWYDMNVLKWIIPGRRRQARLARNIMGLAESARREVQLHGFEPARARLWLAFCDQAENTVYQLIIRSDDCRLDWGLRPHRNRVDYPHLVSIFWWMLLYQFVVFRNRRQGDNTPFQELLVFGDAANSFLQRELSRLQSPAQLPDPWDERWHRQHTMESALGMYNRVYQVLGLSNDLNSRIAHVSGFVSATETAYDRLADDAHTEG
jgi:hypothetical protein